jgi:phosphatidylserine/phosphatidylglycerophosphate/cardiolipin synthase-like enzyme
MSLDPLRDLIRQAIADGRISRAERQNLAALLQNNKADPATLDQLRAEAFNLARAQLPDPQAHAVLEALEDLLRALALAPRTQPAQSENSALAVFSPGDRCLRQIIRLLDDAAQSAALAVFTITDDRISNAIERAHRRGVSIRIVTDNDKAFDPGSDIERLTHAGVPVRVDRSPFHMHHKFAVFDSKILANGSYNWTRGAAEQNVENLVVSSDSSLIAAFSAEFERLWAALA